jgi:hypothetical protein
LRHPLAQRKADGFARDIGKVQSKIDIQKYGHDAIRER